eukprot:gene31282-6428_t
MSTVNDLKHNFEFGSVCFLEGSNCVLRYNCAADVASGSVLPSPHVSSLFAVKDAFSLLHSSACGSGSLFLCDKPSQEVAKSSIGRAQFTTERATRYPAGPSWKFYFEDGFSHWKIGVLHEQAYAQPLTRFDPRLRDLTYANAQDSDTSQPTHPSPTPGLLYTCPGSLPPRSLLSLPQVSFTNKQMLSLCLALIVASGTCPSYVNAQRGNTSTVPEFQNQKEVVLPPERIYTAATAPGGSETDIELTGRFVSTSAHNTLDYSLLLSDGSGTVVLLPRRPSYPLTEGSKKEGATVGLGDLIDLPCAFLTPTTSGADVLYCSGMGLAVFVQGPSKAPTKSAATGERTTNYDIKMLVVVHTASSCSGVQQSLSLAAMRATYIKVSDQVENSSYGS